MAEWVRTEVIALNVCGQLRDVKVGGCCVAAANDHPASTSLLRPDVRRSALPGAEFNLCSGNDRCDAAAA